MKMKHTIWALVCVMFLAPAAASAGDMEPAAAPSSTSSYTLEDIYKRLENGTAGSQSNFSDPSAGPDTPTGHTLDQVMEKAPKKNDTNGATAGEVTIGKKFWGLNTATGKWGLQTGSRWRDNGDGTVTDRNTGLVWLKNANCVETLATIENSTGMLSWADAMIWGSALKSGVCGLTDDSTEGDWRLPTKNELEGLANGDEAVRSSAMQAFENVQSYYYWSATSAAGHPTNAWYVLLSFGGVASCTKTGTDYVWPVRAGQSGTSETPLCRR